MNTIKKPGEKACTSGQYGEINTAGKPTGRESTVVKGEPLPPTMKKGYRWVLVDKTKHKKK